MSDDLDQYVPMSNEVDRLLTYECGTCFVRTYERGTWFILGLFVTNNLWSMSHEVINLESMSDELDYVGTCERGTS